MPQMMPLSWLSLYIFFSIMLLMFCFMNYSIILLFHIQLYHQKKMINITTMNWKW